ncbi:MAG: ATP-binding cassette domain-containing protein [Nitrospirae bacterium]|nr:ATP-binding cassette domain-containing protein [Magnetococcales bacterium]HAT49722.1 ABC transporter permease [Alphaproteobacteria bacterium]
MKDTAIYKRLWALIRPFRWQLVFALLCMIFMAASNGAIAYMVQPLVDEVFIRKNPSLVMWIPLLIMLFFIVRGVAFFFQSYLITSVGHRFVQSLQTQLYDKMLHLDIAHFLSRATGGYISRLIFDINMIRSVVSTTIADILREVFTVFFLFGVVIHQAADLALVSVLGIPVVGYLIFRFGLVMRRLSRKRQELMEEVTGHLEETISGMQVVKTFSMERYENQVFAEITGHVLANQLRATAVDSFAKPSVDMVAGIAISAVVLVAGQTIVNGEATPGTLFSFLTALMMAFSPLKRVTMLYNNLQGGMAAAQRVFELMDTQAAIVERPGAITPGPIADGIRYEGVGFRYDQTGHDVLSGINLTVRKGEKVALVGQSGSGKTTLVNLLPRLFDVHTGSIRIDGVDIRDMTLDGLRGQIAIVNQDSQLFNDTIRNNIAYGRMDADPVAVESVARMANAWDFIQEFPEGLNTRVGNRGVMLSGGQRQRIAIARALLKPASILILDEATSALDTQNERLVQDALDRLINTYTTLIIAHRLSTVRNADRIVVFNQGRIVEEGSHDQLIAKNGEYARLYTLQFSKTNTAATP